MSLRSVVGALPRHMAELTCAAHIPARCNYTHVNFSLKSYTKLKYRSIPHPNDKSQPQHERVALPPDFRKVYPEFLAFNDWRQRNKLKEHLERRDMLARRARLDIPEFYVGSIMAVTVSDENHTDKENRFVGICIDRGGSGTRAWFILRNYIDGQGIEIRYDMYCPLIASIETLRLEKRLDEHLLYLRDALPEYSSFPMDMEQEVIADDAPVPVNELKVKMIPPPWHPGIWKYKKGIDYEDHLDEYTLQLLEKKKDPYWLKFDLMKEYRKTVPEEEQEEAFRDMAPQYPKLRRAQRLYRRK